MATILITGANRGLGLEFARQYANDGWRVIATCRNQEKATELAAIAGVEIHALDVTDFNAVAKLADEISPTPIDVLLNNAGIYGPYDYTLEGIDYKIWQDVLRTNTMAPLCVSQCFAPLVAKSEKKCIATLSSKMGSMTDNTSGGSYIYRSSKAALNAVMKSLANDLKPLGVAVVSLHPGWVRTDMGGANGLIGAPESVRGLREVISKTNLKTSGGFYDYNGAEIGW